MIRSIGLVLLCLGTGSCASSRREWRELDAPEVAFEDAWETFADLARQNGYSMDAESSDRGLRKFQSRWKSRELGFGRSHRSRLCAEFERTKAAPGWTIRYYVERQKVGDFAMSMRPTEDDWSADGQDTEAEQIFGTQMRMRLGMAIHPDQPKGGG